MVGAGQTRTHLVGEACQKVVMASWQPQPSLLLCIAQFPPTRQVVLGVGLYLLLGVKNGFWAQFASAPRLALAVEAAMSAIGLAVYTAFVRLVEKRHGTAVLDFGRQTGPCHLATLEAKGRVGVIFSRMSTSL